MDTTHTQGLSPRLDHALRHLSVAGLAPRLRKVYLAAAQAIARLSDLDLVRYETHVEESGADLSLWEEMAPVIRDTVLDVNALLGELRQEFPPDESSAESPEAASAVGVLQKGAQELSSGVAQLGAAMRNPAVMADRWNLLAELQTFRARFREQLGSLVHASISCFVDLHPRDVVPGYLEELRSVVVLRAISADLQRVIAARLDKVRDADPADMVWNAQQLQNELDTFGKTGAYRSLRAQDKRHLVEFRARVGELAAEQSLSRGRLVLCVQEIHEFVGTLLGVSQRPILQTHDREVMAHAAVKVEQSAQLATFDPDAAGAALAEAIASAQALYGRHPELDTFLRKLRKVDVARLPSEEQQSLQDGLLQHLAGLNAT